MKFNLCAKSLRSLLMLSVCSIPLVSASSATATTVATWMPLSPSTPPSTRSYLAMTYDAAKPAVARSSQAEKVQRPVIQARSATAATTIRVHSRKFAIRLL